MSRLVSVERPEIVERFARRDVALHIYELGDLDPFFWPQTRWWGLAGAGEELRALALLYSGGDTSSGTLLALGRDDGGAVGELAALLRDDLPARVYAHLSPGVVDALAGRFTASTSSPTTTPPSRATSAWDSSPPASTTNTRSPRASPEPGVR